MIFRKLSYRQSNLNNNKKNYGTQVPCEFFQITRFSSNQVSKQGYFVTSFGQNGQIPILANEWLASIVSVTVSPIFEKVN